MKTTLDRIASVLAFAIGVMAVYAGGKVLMGRIPDWSVLSWLPLYNYTLGLLIVMIAVPLLWKGGRSSLATAIVTLSINAGVLILLQTAFDGRVAAESIRAMTQRVAVWLVILVLALVGSRVRKTATRPQFSGETLHSKVMR